MLTGLLRLKWNEIKKHPPHPPHPPQKNKQTTPPPKKKNPTQKTEQFVSVVCKMSVSFSESETKGPQFSRIHFQINFLIRKLLSVWFNFQ